MTTLLLVGRTGNGKSSTGNSIIGSRAFLPRSSSAQFVVETHEKASSGDITVVDGSGIGDTGTDLIGGVDRALANSEYVFNLCGKKVSAFILVMKYGVRFTKQERDAVDMIKSLFGNGVLERWGIVLMTHGDNFELDYEDEAFTFDQWYLEQVGEIKNLIESCNYRCVLFNNKTSDLGKKQKQLNILLEKVASLNNIFYTAKDFQDASIDRDKLRLQSQIPKIEREIKSFVDEIRFELDNAPGNIDAKIRADENLLAKVEDRIAELKVKDLGTGMLQSAHNELKLLELTILSKLNSARQERDTQIYREEINGRQAVHSNTLQTVQGNSPFRLIVVIILIASAIFLVYRIIF